MTWRHRIATTVSLLLVAATIFLWIRSYSVTDHLGRHRTRRYVQGTLEHRSGVFSADGRIWFSSATRFPVTVPSVPAMPPLSLLRPEPASRPSDETSEFGCFSGDFQYWTGERDEVFILGFGVNHSGRSNSQWDDDHWRVTAIPHAAFVLVFLIQPVLSLVGANRSWSTSRWLAWLFSSYIVLAFLTMTALAFAPCAIVMALLIIALLVAAPIINASRARNLWRAGLCPA